MIENKLIATRSGIPLSVIEQYEKSKVKADKECLEALRIGFDYVINKDITYDEAMQLADRKEELENCLMEVGSDLENVKS